MYEVDDAPAPQESDLKQITTLVKRQRELEQLVATKERELDEAKSKLRDVAEIELPTLLQSVGLSSLATSDGAVVSIEEKIRASIAKGNQSAAHEWLEENGHGGIIKHKIDILFGRDEAAWAAKFMRDCAQRKKQLNLKRTDSVHNSTLCALVREMLKEGTEFPEDLFGVFRQRVAKVTEPK